MKDQLIRWMLPMAIILFSLDAYAQSIRVTGTVTDSDGAVPGVSVVESGTKNGTMTDIDGQYSINVTPGSTLVFTGVGYKEQKIQVGKNSVINVKLEEDSQMIDELVVVGYGVQRKSDVATSVASVKTEEMKAYPSSNVADMLRGRAAGVNVTSTSGQPGSVASITIRGNRSISASNSPLYVIDGSPARESEFSALSPSDIESIEILKDAAAQAIYGARASDGVILVTTKRGKSGKVEVDYNGYVGIQSLWRNFDFYSPAEFVQLRREVMAHDNGLNPADITDEIAINDEMMQRSWDSKQFLDWEKLMFHNSVSHNHEVSVRGGNEKTRVAAGANYFNQDGMVVVNSGYRKMSLRLNVDMEIAKWLSLGINTSYAQSKAQREDGNFNSFITCTPLGRLYDDEGNYSRTINTDGYYNPFYRAENFGHEINTDSYRVNIFTDVKPFKGFNYRFNASIYNRTKEDGQCKYANYPGGGSTASLEEGRIKDWLIENIITYTVPFKSDIHQLSLTAVQSVDHKMQKSIGYDANNLPIDRDWNFISQGNFVGSPIREYQENNLISFMARAQYSLFGRYLLNFAVRRDGSSRFGKENKWGTFPSAAFAWRMEQEKFLRDVTWLDNLKLRLSYGVVGNQNGIGNYETLGLAVNQGYEFGDNYQAGYTPMDTFSNPNLKWEQSATVNTGIDFSLFKGRFNGMVEFYSTRTKNLLVSRSINAATGYTSMLDNLGGTRSEGVDLSINGDVVRNREFNWNMGINFSYYKNKIVRIDDTVDENGKPASQKANNWLIGQPINVYYNDSYKIDGIFQYDDFNVSTDASGKQIYTLKDTYDSDGDGIADRPVSYPMAIEPGMIKVRDLNNDGKIDDDDRVVVAKDPKFTMSLSSTWTWKGIDLYMDWYGVYGRHIRNPYLYDFNHGGSLAGKLNGIKVDYWTPDNPTNDFPRPSANTVSIYQKSIAIQDASYVRLRTLQVGYTFPQSLIKKTPLSKLRLYATATNLLTFTKFKSYSPEFTSSSYPEARQWVFGLNVSF